jgi:hypothetical protein
LGAAGGFFLRVVHSGGEQRTFQYNPSLSLTPPPLVIRSFLVTMATVWCSRQHLQQREFSSLAPIEAGRYPVLIVARTQPIPRSQSEEAQMRRALEMSKAEERRLRELEAEEDAQLELVLELSRFEARNGWKRAHLL